MGAMIGKFDLWQALGSALEAWTGVLTSWYERA